MRSWPLRQEETHSRSADFGLATPLATGVICPRLLPFRHRKVHKGFLPTLDVSVTFSKDMNSLTITPRAPLYFWSEMQTFQLTRVCPTTNQ